MTDEQLREAVARAMCDAVNVEGTYEETGTLHREKVWLTSADAAIALMRPVIRAETLEDVVQMLAGREDLIGAVQFRHIAAAIRALKEKPNE